MKRRVEPLEALVTPWAWTLSLRFRGAGLGPANLASGC